MQHNVLSVCHVARGLMSYDTALENEKNRDAAGQVLIAHANSFSRAPYQPSLLQISNVAWAWFIV